MNNNRKYSNINCLWGYSLVEELSRSIVNTVSVTPGSRNTPLVTPLTHVDGLESISVIDERNSGFLALGESMNTSHPVATICTSGTATSEFYPAVKEAHHGRVPMLVITADRPPELQKGGANQTIDQQSLFRESLRWFLQLPEPEIDARKFRALRTNVQRAVHKTTYPEPGPVHLNVPFRKPLEPTPKNSERVKEFSDNNPAATSGRKQEPFVELHGSNPKPKRNSLDKLEGVLSEAENPIVFAGPENGHDVGTMSGINRFCEKYDIPLLADPLSNRRTPSSINYYEWILPNLTGSPIAPPDLVLRVGSPPNASNKLMDHFAESTAHQIGISAGSRWQDSGYQLNFRIETVINSALDKLNFQESPGNTQWRKTWSNTDTRVANHIEASLDEESEFLGPKVIRSTLEAVTFPAELYIGNSTPIRDLIQFGGNINSDIRLFGNRGTSGIDGQISTVAGLSNGSEKPVIGIIGDVGYLHDMNSLHLLEQNNLNVLLIVINNDGGGIFHRLPIEDYDPPFSGMVKTPHGLEFESSARQFDIPYERLETPDALRSEIANFGSGNDRSKIIEIPVDPEKSQRFRERIEDEVFALMED